MNNLQFRFIMASTLGVELNSQTMPKCKEFVSKLKIELNEKQKISLTAAIRNRCGRGNNNFEWLERLYNCVLTSRILNNNEGD